MEQNSNYLRTRISFSKNELLDIIVSINYLHKNVEEEKRNNIKLDSILDKCLNGVKRINKELGLQDEVLQ